MVLPEGGIRPQPRPAWPPCCRTGAPAAAPPMARSSIPACWSAPIARCNCPPSSPSGTWRTGWSCSVRVNDRGPAQPGRVIGLSPRAAHAARHSGRRHRPGAADGGGQRRAARWPAPCRRPSAAARRSRRRRPRRSSARPSRRCPAPAGGAAARGAARPAAVTVADAAAELPPDPLPEAAAPAPRHARAAVMSKPASSSAATWRAPGGSGLARRVEPFGQGRQPQFRVRLGPYADVAAADRAVGRGTGGRAAGG